MKRISCIVVSLSLALSLALPASAAAPSFPDVPQDYWGRPYIQEMTQKGVVTGVGGGLFEPEGPVSTAQLAVMLTAAFCPETVNLDVPAGTPWWMPYLDAARAAGYLTDTTASWDYFQAGAWDEETVTDPMTRYDMAQAMWNTVLAEGMALPTDQAREEAPSKIGDFASIPEDYESAVVSMYALGYLSGDDRGNFNGESSMTRAQVCVALCHLLDVDVTLSGAEQPADTVSAYEQEVFDLVNQIRAERGLKPFVYNETLAQVARAHSQDMIDRDFFDHTNPDGDGPDDRVSAAGVRWSQVAENIAAGQRTPEEVVTSWMNSPGHRANILGSCKELGVGLALGGSYGCYWTQCFATER